MLIGTFTPQCGWNGKTVEYDEVSGQFTLQGQGLVPARQVLKFEEPPGDFEWASPEARALVEAAALAAVEAAKQDAEKAALVPRLRGIKIATFAPNFEEAGRRFSFEQGQFFLEGHGPVSALDILEHDQRMPLVWASTATRATVQVYADTSGVLVATVNEKAELAGSRVNLRDEELLLEGRGPVALRDISEADRVGLLSWESEELHSAVLRMATYDEIPAKARVVYEANNGSRFVDFVIEGAGSQCLVALRESCIIVKPGIMAGATGGGRFTEFHYSDITGIEVNTGMLSAVLEVTTPAYQGRSKDYWRAGPNTDPFKVSNCLPGSKPLFCQGLGASRIEELRSRVRQAKQRPQSATSSPSTDPAEQIRKLAELRDAGILSPEEFDEAKRKILEAM